MVRHKNRYFVIRVRDGNTSETDNLTLKPPSLCAAIMKKLQILHGDFGVAAVRAGFTTKYCNPLTKIGIIRSRHGPHTLVASVLPIINTVENKQVALETMYTGATIMQCYKFIKRYQQRKYAAVCSKITSNDEKLALRSMLHCKNVLHIT